MKEKKHDVQYVFYSTTSEIRELVVELQKNILNKSS